MARWRSAAATDIFEDTAEDGVESLGRGELPADGDGLMVYHGSYFDPSFFSDLPSTPEAVNAVVARTYRNASAEEIENALRESLGDVLLEDVEDFLGTLGSISQAALPVLLPVIGTAVGGSLGGAIGAAAGQLAARAIGKTDRQ